MKNIEEELGEE